MSTILIRSRRRSIRPSNQHLRHAIFKAKFPLKVRHILPACNLQRAIYGTVASSEPSSTFSIDSPQLSRTYISRNIFNSNRSLILLAYIDFIDLFLNLNKPIILNWKLHLLLFIFSFSFFCVEFNRNRTVFMSFIEKTSSVVPCSSSFFSLSSISFLISFLVRSPRVASRVV